MSYNRYYTPISPDARNKIINDIIQGDLTSECITGLKNKWWINKHNPKNEIPKNIYLLGNGTKEELYNKYQIEYGNIDKNIFMSYIRELIKQKILI